MTRRLPLRDTLPLHAGVTLKPQHFPDVLDRLALAAVHQLWLEIHPQNYFHAGGARRDWLKRIAVHAPLSFHSTGLSLGSAQGCNRAQLAALAQLCDEFAPAMVSDHLSWSDTPDAHLPDLLPIPYTRAALTHIAGEIARVQDRLQRTILIENPSRMLAFAADEMDEPTFLNTLCHETGCGLLLDINNILVSATNLGGDTGEWLARIDPALVGEIHLAGHAIEDHPTGPLAIDDHGSAVSAACWDQYADWIATHGPAPTLIEWDNDVPSLAVLLAEADTANAIINHVASDHARAA